MLLAGAGLLFRGVLRAGGIEPGFETGHLMIASINTGSVAPSPGARAELIRKAIEQVRALPEVAFAAWADRPPFPGHGYGDFTDERGTYIPTAMNAVSDGYFDTVDIPFVAGRNFTQAEIDSAAPVVVIDQAAADRAFPGRSPLGRQIGGLRWRDFPHSSATIIGVVKSVRTTYLSKPDAAFVYIPKQLSAPFGGMLIRTRTRPATAFHSILNALEKAHPNLPSETTLVTMEQVPLAVQRLMVEAPAVAASMLGALALILTAVGIFGLVSQLVAQRTREIAIRAALGARSSDIGRLVAGQTLRPVILGGAFGIAGAAAISSLLASMVASPDMPDLTYGAGAFSPLTLALTLAALGLMIALAAAAPVRRALRIGPAEALRNE
jgi:hypothetical protein